MQCNMFSAGAGYERGSILDGWAYPSSHNPAAITQGGKTALMVAANYNHGDVAALLVEANARVNLQDAVFLPLDSKISCGVELNLLVCFIKFCVVLN